MTTRFERRKHHPRHDQAVFDDLCSILHIGAWTVSDVLFDDSSSVEDDRDDDFTQSRTNRPFHDEDETLEDTATYNNYNDHIGAGGVDGDDSLTTRMEIDLEDYERAAESSECDNTLTDISSILSSRLSCSHRFRCRGSQSSRLGVVSDDDERSESNILSIVTTPSLFDENDDVDRVGKHQQRSIFHRSHSLYHRTSPNDHTVLTSKRKKKKRGSYRLKQMVAKGVQQFNSCSYASNKVGRLEMSSRPRAMFGATSQCQHDGPTRTGAANLATTRRLNVREEVVPFDEPLWYN